MTDFNPNIPQGTDNISVSQPQIQNNFSESNTIFGTDHYEFDYITAASRGLHRKVTFPVVASAPALGGNAGIVNVRTGSTGNPELFYVNSVGSVQLSNSSQGDPGSAKAWVRFNGNGGAVITASSNVTSVTRSSAGVYVVNFTNAFANTNYACVGSINSAGIALFAILDIQSGPTSTSSWTIRTLRIPNGAGTTIEADNPDVCLAFYGTLA